MHYLIIFFFFTVSLFGFNYHLKPYKIIDGIHCFFGIPSQVSYKNGGNMVNSCYIETEEGYIVIDSGPTYNYAQNAYEIMETIKKIPVKYVINTSLSEVHILGNQFYKEQGAILLGPEGYKEKFLFQKKLELAKILPSDILINTKIVPLDQYIDADLTLKLASINLNIKYIRDDNRHIYVYIKNKKLLFAGDMIYNNRLPALEDNRSLLTWKKELNNLVKLDWDDLVSSHGYMTRRSAIKNTKSYLSLLEKEVQESIDKGYLKSGTIRRVKLLEFSEDRLYSIWHHQNVATVYDELYILKKRYTPIKVKLKEALIPEIIVKKKKKLRIKKKYIKKKNISKHKIEKKTRIMSKLHYISFISAMKRAKNNHKIVFVKVRSTTCRYCDQLDKVLKSNNEIINQLNKYFEVVEINSDYEPIPLDVPIRITPTLLFIRPDNKEVLMQLPGIRALGELLDIVNEAITDGHNGAYLKP